MILTNAFIVLEWFCLVINMSAWRYEASDGCHVVMLKISHQDAWNREFHDYRGSVSISHPQHPEDFRLWSIEPEHGIPLSPCIITLKGTRSSPHQQRAPHPMVDLLELVHPSVDAAKKVEYDFEFYVPKRKSVDLGTPALCVNVPSKIGKGLRHLGRCLLRLPFLNKAVHVHRLTIWDREEERRAYMRLRAQSAETIQKHTLRLSLPPEIASAKLPEVHLDHASLGDVIEMIAALSHAPGEPQATLLATEEMPDTSILSLTLADAQPNYEWAEMRQKEPFTVLVSLECNEPISVRELFEKINASLLSVKVDIQSSEMKHSP